MPIDNPETIRSWDYHALWNELRQINVELPQHSREFRPLMEFLETLQLHNLVEVGTREGGSLFMLSRIMAPGATIISVDLPGQAWGRNGSEEKKRQIADRLRRDGFTVHLVERDSSLPATAAEVATLLGGSPIEALFLDGDHSFHGILGDFQNYLPLVKSGAPLIFHDIADSPKTPAVQVHYLWRVIKALTPHIELMASPENGQGIGIAINSGLTPGFDVWKQVAAEQRTL